VGLEEDFVVTPPDLLAGVTGEMLAEAFVRATEERPEDQVDLSHVTVDAVTVAETVGTLARELPRRGPITFRALVEGIGVRLEIIVHFLAVLELCKLGRVSLGQGSTFGDLQISWIGDEPDPESIFSGTLEVDDYDG
jgi:segregation and condensation protein A